MKRIRPLLLLCLSISFGHVTAAETKPPAGHFDLSHWKLTLPVSASGTAVGKAMEIPATKLSAGYTDAQCFHTGTNGEMVFWCPVTGATTEGSEYPRTELREVIVPTDDAVCWAAPGTHVLDVRCRVSEVPSSQKVIIGQIHGYSGKAKPLIKLQFFKGRVEALGKESPAKGKDLKLSFPEVGLDQDFDYQIKLQGGLLSVTVNGATQAVNVFEKDPDWAGQTLYFKVGAYVQDNEGPASEGARVSVSKLNVSHSSSATEPTRILIVVGPTDHPPGTHEVAAGGRLMKHCLENMANLPSVKVDLFNEWPKDKAVRDAASTIVFIGDTFPPNRLPDAGQNLAELEAMMQRGCGIVCVHYATGLLGEDVKPDGDHPLLRWLGGYFANRSCPHHESFAKIFSEATISPAAPQHPVWRGCRAFTLNDEPYFNNYFGKDGNQPATSVTVLATSMLPPAAPKRETVSWCIERSDTGRGFAVVMPHFYRNWKLEDLRRYLLNGIVWTAKLDVPATGVQTTLPELNTFAPISLEPQTPAPKAKPAPDKAAAASK
jgi:type 1 glutamine amidotransferase